MSWKSRGLGGCPRSGTRWPRTREPGGGTLEGAGGAQAQLPLPGLHTLVLDSEH